MKLARHVILGLIAYQGTLAQAADCVTYPVHPLIEPIRPADCSGQLRLDSDGDGLPDWTNQWDGRSSSNYVMADPDIGDDGWLNLEDPAPFEAQIRGQQGFPKHLFKGPLGSKDKPDVRLGLSQLALWHATGILAVNARAWHSPRVLDQLRQILQFGLSNKVNKTLTTLRYVIADSSISQRRSLAYYSKDLAALIIAGADSHITNPNVDTQWQQLMTLAHEVAHAITFSTLTPAKLTILANNHGPWKLRLRDLTAGFFSFNLFQRNPLFGAPAKNRAALANVPTSYALANVHEWFAECLAGEIVGQLVELKVLEAPTQAASTRVRPLTPAFREWIHQRYFGKAHSDIRG